MKDIYKFIKIISNDLKINKPQVQIKKLEGNKLAAYDIKQKTIIIKKDYENTLDLYFAIAHELRHKWQIDNEVYNFEDYKTSEELSVKEYNLQEQEIDANAYAYLIIVSVFHIQPLFNGLDEEIKNKIKTRAEEIAKQ